jgi:hypothetical protein
MNIIRRPVSEKEAVSPESAAEPTVRRRIEVTVERETVTMLVRGQASAELQALGEIRAKAVRLELPPSAAVRTNEPEYTPETSETMQECSLTKSHPGARRAGERDEAVDRTGT